MSIKDRLFMLFFRSKHVEIYNLKNEIDSLKLKIEAKDKEINKLTTEVQRAIDAGNAKLSDDRIAWQKEVDIWKTAYETTLSQLMKAKSEVRFMLYNDSI